MLKWDLLYSCMVFAGAEGAEMNLEDLEKHLESLKKMFIEKQKMMEQLEKTKGEGGAK